ncbi:MAG: 4'-phosphopantetheinyl transferase superfamily protein [Candidatus Babeliales bacterium]|nr:4'-phosphopantetheinyl transferase superfamily protein [Candidatus Babeliales bacterium]
MILGIGIDSVEIERFVHWTTFPQKSLERIFSAPEIEYCLSCPAKSAERFAARFAIREALLKALQSAFPEERLALLAICKAIRIEKTDSGAPIAYLTGLYPQNFSIKISWTHTKTTATAIVCLQNQ